MATKRVIIIGGGASGVILAAHLLRVGEGLTVTLVERTGAVGRGVAYGTAEPDHILNTRAGSMSAFAQDPEHFWRWLLASGASGDERCSDAFCFAPRQVYAAYLASLLKPWGKDAGDGRLDLVHGECIGLKETRAGVAAELADRTVHVGHAAVLATGHEAAGRAVGGPYASAWIAPADCGIRPDDRIFVVGTGLSMVDAVVALTNAGHRGRITALSRHGQLPRIHRRTAPMTIDAADIPFGTDVSYLLRWFRRTAAWAIERGGGWRDVMDGIRPHTAELWQSLSPAARSRFLRHARTWWEVHRHRLPPESDVRLRAARATGLLEVLAGRFLGVDEDGGSLRVRYRRRGGGDIETASVARIIDCTGILRDPQENEGGLVSSLIAKGLARPDPLRIGIDVDAACAVIDRTGAPSKAIFAIGPVTRARFWEVTAIPDIRIQCAALAARIDAAPMPGISGAPAPMEDSSSSLR